MEDLTSLLDGRYWASTQTLPRAESGVAPAPAKRRKTKKVAHDAAAEDPPSPDKLPLDGMDGRYWKDLENSRRAQRKKKRAQVELTSELRPSESSSGEVGEEEEESNSSDRFREEQREEREEREAEALAEAIRAQGVGPLWRAMASDVSVSHTACWRRFLALHARLELAEDWVTFAMLVEERPCLDELSLLRFALLLAVKWRTVDFAVLRRLQPSFSSSFGVPRCLLECADFSHQLPALSDGNSQEAWLELVRIYMRDAGSLVNEWFLSENPGAPNVSAVFAVFLAKYCRDDSFLGKPLVRGLSLEGYCLLLKCLVCCERDIEMINLPFVDRLRSVQALDFTAVTLLDSLFLLRGGVLPRAYRGVVLETLATLAPRFREQPGLYIALCNAGRSFVRVSVAGSLRPSIEHLVARAPEEPFCAYVAHAGLSEAEPLFFESLGKLVNNAETWSALLPPIPDWSAFVAVNYPDHLDLVLRQLVNVSPLAASLVSCFGEKVYTWAKLEPQTRMSRLGLTRAVARFVADWRREWVLPIMGLMTQLSANDPLDDYLRDATIELFLKSLTKDQCWKALVALCGRISPPILATVTKRVFCSLPDDLSKVAQWFAAELWLLSMLDKANRRLPVDCVDSVIHLVRNATVAFGPASVHGAKVKLKVMGLAERLFDCEASRIAVVGALRRSADIVCHAHCETDSKLFDAFPPLKLVGTARDNDFKSLTKSLNDKLH